MMTFRVSKDLKMRSMFYFIWADSSGRVYKVILMFTDVTERLAKVTLRVFFFFATGDLQVAIQGFDY